MTRDDIAVTGLGLLTPAGLTPHDNWTTLCDGTSLAAADPELAGLPVDFSCQMPPLDTTAELGRARVRRLDPFTRYALIAARRALADAHIDAASWDGNRVGVILGVGSNSLHTYPEGFASLNDGRPHHVPPHALPRSLPNMAATEVAIDVRAFGPAFSTTASCASGATALAVARDLLRSGTCDIVLAGGSESGRSRMTATCFHQLRALSRRRDRPELACRPFDESRDGLVLGEGAAVFVLERHSSARARRAPVRAVLRGVGLTSDAHDPVAPRPDGTNAAHALSVALADAGLHPSDIGHINAHGTGTRHGDAAEATALTRVFGPEPPPVTAPKSIIGHTMGAAGAVEAAYTVLALQHQAIPPTANHTHQDGDHKLDIVTTTPRPSPATAAVNCSFGFGGHNAITIFTTP
ncbi:beta-ketoacyl-[acyl-carrier-protein] synthase family protein [Yinghuangia sp. ASG 101]|uniref:beta-ketoacyl-[acyl-carrier-protein] synthase family protein n=1 Tax=Yinghuangia sp. ASG 101 TaxID=2896848 RepID=UPI001E284D1D|nr:beta-ketoacyl-[acyl-carrier-protein] synthase family protein [Yinghuangia sp. ASG 101]UGQ11904.1 beta-ketoacyl-[acyl-carrier-protein] synthase family protein [Yinghuangia sp. ASG 101]